MNAKIRFIKNLAIILLTSHCYSQVTVLIPNGGEHWDGGSHQYIYWTVQATTSNNFRIELSTDNGVNWSTLASQIYAPNGMFGFDCPDLSSSRCRIRISDLPDSSNADMSDSTFSIHKSDLGLAWVLRPSGTSADLNSVAFIDSLHGWICGNNGTLLMTEDGGGTWNPIASGVTNDLYSVRFSHRGIGIAVGSDGTIVKSIDFGLTWNKKNSDTTANIYDIAFCNDDTVIAVGYGGTILRSTDAGDSWKPVYGHTEANLYNICFKDSSQGIITGGDGPYSSEHAFVLVTSDGGESWTFKNTMTDWFGWGGCSYLNDSVIVLAGGYSFTFGSRSEIVRSTDCGETWQEIFGFSNIGTFGPMFFLSVIKFIDSEHGFVIGNNGYGTSNESIIIHTSDMGVTWDLDKAYYFSGCGIYDMSFTSPLNGVIVGTGGKIYQTESGGLVSVIRNINIDIIKHFTLFQNYPNPFNPSTTIQYSIPTTNNVSLKIYNVLGEEIVTLVNGQQNAGVNSVIWNAEGFPSGVYFCRITAGKYSETNKLMLLR